jgi:tRNA splicing ligase
MTSSASQTGARHRVHSLIIDRDISDVMVTIREYQKLYFDGTAPGTLIALDAKTERTCHGGYAVRMSSNLFMLFCEGIRHLPNPYLLTVYNHFPIQFPAC